MDEADDLMAIVVRLGSGAEQEDDDGGDLGYLRDAHWPIEDQAWGESQASTRLVAWLDHESDVVRRGAAEALGHIAPCALLRAVRQRLAEGEGDAEPQSIKRQRCRDYSEGICRAVGTLGDHYIGDYCPGFLDTLADDPVALDKECRKITRLCEPLAEFYQGDSCGKSLAELLRMMKPDHVEGN